MALDALGDGEPGIAVREGWPTPRSADAELGEVAGMAGEDPNVRMRPLSYPGRTRIGSALLGLGRRALTVACLGPGQRQGGPDSLALERAVRLVVGVARRVDAEHAQATRG
jgi:hypothetical protein